MRSGRGSVGLALVAITLVAIGGCARLGLQNTPAQDRALQAWKACDGRYASVTLKDVSPDGQLSFYYKSPSDAAAAQACFQQAWAAIGRRTGVGPAPAADPGAEPSPAAIPIWHP